jgi:endonuclease/exonuclease/phosphatase family metal-dependent hydrolase
VSRIAGLAILISGIAAPACHAAVVPVLTPTNTVLRVLAANLTENSQKYEAPQIRILQGLKPDIVAIQEFNFSNNTPAQIRLFVDTAFGTNFQFFRETNAGYSIPNGIISRWPIAQSGSWDDVQVPDRGFAWARLDVPGTNDLHIVSVHLHSGGGESSRSIEATNLKSLIQSNFPANAWIMVAGDFNTDVRSEAALTTCKTYLSDDPIPTDAVSGGDPDTNGPRSKPYDYILPSFNLTNTLTPVTIGSLHFTNGLVFDSRVYSPLSDVAPVLTADSGAGQHMAVIKDFRINYAVTNFVNVDPPRLVFEPPVIRWEGASNLTYTVQSTTNLIDWITNGTVTSSSGAFFHTNPFNGDARRFFRVSHP